MDDQISSLKLSVPEQTLTALSFCDANPKHLQSWITDLPMANIGETAKKLYHAIIELNQLIIAPQTRLQLMEVIRPSIYYISRELSKHFLNQSVALPEKQRKIANLTMALHLHCANGYKLVVLEFLETLSSSKQKKNLPLPCHRAISDLSRCILRSYQLYSQSPPNVWLDIHQLARLAQQKKLFKATIEDKEYRFEKETSIIQRYKRILLLACCKPNQIRQSDLSSLYDLFEKWVDHIELNEKDSGKALFIINQESDLPPVYRSLHSGGVTDQCCGLDSTVLVEKITESIAYMMDHEKSADHILNMPIRLDDNLMIQLSQALGILTKRNFKRIPRKGTLTVAAGLTSSHYFSANQTEFNDFLLGRGGSPVGNYGVDDNQFVDLARQPDIWAAEFNASRGRDDHSAKDSDISPINYTGYSARKPSEKENVTYKTVVAPLINTSPGGYCLQWRGNMPANVQAGEVMIVREKDTHPWSIAAVRWVRQTKQHGAQIGVELLAPNCRPCGVQLIQKTGDHSEFLRGLLLPELPSISQPMTLVTPRLPFQVGQKVAVNKNGRKVKCQLSRRITATGSFSQFELRFLNKSPAPTDEAKQSKSVAEDDFDSLWPTL